MLEQYFFETLTNNQEAFETYSDQQVLNLNIGHFGWKTLWKTNLQILCTGFLSWECVYK